MEVKDTLKRSSNWSTWIYAAQLWTHISHKKPGAQAKLLVMLKNWDWELLQLWVEELQYFEEEEKTQWEAIIKWSWDEHLFLFTHHADNYPVYWSNSSADN